MANARHAAYALIVNILQIGLRINLKLLIIMYNVIGININDVIVYATASSLAISTNGLFDSLNRKHNFMNHGMPSDNKIDNELEPSELAIPVPAWPRRAIIAPVIISAVQPPMAITVKPRIDSEMPIVAPVEKIVINFSSGFLMSINRKLTNDDEHPKDEICNKTNP